MPYLPPAELSDLNRKDRTKLESLLQERAVLGYAFSYTKLHRLLESLVEDADAAIQDCISAVDDDSLKTAKSDLTDRISAIYAENNLSSVLFQDPFGRKMNSCLYESKTGARLNQTKMVESAPGLINVSSAKIQKLIDACTEPGKSYTALRLMAVKEK